LEKPPFATDIAIPKGVYPSAFASERAIQDFVGLNLFKQLFGADVTAELDCMNEYDALIKTAFGAGTGSAISATGGLEKLERCRQALYARVADTAPAKNMMAAAQKLGYDGKTRMIDFIWILMFAGYGGSGDLTIGTFNTVRSNPEKMVKLYRKDPDAFLLETSRLNPPVAGMNPFTLTQNLTIQNVDGTPRTFQPGTWGGILISGANKDPTLYPDPYEFKPDRANLDQILTWNAELRDIRKCKNTAGFPSCKEAPRPCPGTWLALRTVKSAISFFMDGVEESLGKKGEL
jgi:cytochrome P450